MSAVAVRRHAKFPCGCIHLLLLVILCFRFCAGMPYRPTDSVLLVEQVVLMFLLRTVKKLVKKNFVVVSATLLGTQDPRQALESVSQEQPRTFLEIVRHCVASPVFNCCSHRSNHFATTCFFF